MSKLPIRVGATFVLIVTFALTLSPAAAQTPPSADGQTTDPHNAPPMRGGAKMGGINMNGGTAQPQTSTLANQANTSHSPPPMVGGAKMGGMNMSRPVSHADMHHHKKSLKTPKTAEPS